jgi:hypothetical protein
MPVHKAGHDDAVRGVDVFGLSGAKTYSDLRDPTIFDEDVSVGEIGSAIPEG